MREETSVIYKKRNTSEQQDTMRKAILLAFEQLLQNYSYVDIRVNRICSEAHISKPTFYRYFRSKEDIVRWLSEEAIRCGAAEVGRKYTWSVAYYRTLLVIDHYRAFYEDPRGPALLDPLNTFCGEYLKLVLSETLTKYKGIILTNKLSFQITTFIYLQSLLLQQWGARERQQSAEAYAQYLSSVVPYDLFACLEEPSDSKAC